MGAQAQRPDLTKTGQQTNPGQAPMKSSDFYQSLLNNQRQQVANVPAVQQAQNKPQTPPNRPITAPPGFGAQQQGQVGSPDNRYQGAYDAYMQRFGGGQQPQNQPPANPDADLDQQPPQQQQPKQRPGIRMGGGYASRD